MVRWNPAKSLARNKPDGAAPDAAQQAKKAEKPHKHNPKAKPIDNQVRKPNE
jgi:hypothetical protein